MRRRWVKYWWLWAAIAAIAIIGNELFDHYGGAGNTSSHPAADVLIAIVLVLVVSLLWEYVTRRRLRR